MALIIKEGTSLAGRPRTGGVDNFDQISKPFITPTDDLGGFLPLEHMARGKNPKALFARRNSTRMKGAAA